MNTESQTVLEVRCSQCAERANSCPLSWTSRNSSIDHRLHHQKSCNSSTRRYHCSQPFNFINSFPRATPVNMKCSPTDTFHLLNAILGSSLPAVPHVNYSYFCIILIFPFSLLYSIVIFLIPIQIGYSIGFGKL